MTTTTRIKKIMIATMATYISMIFFLPPIHFHLFNSIVVFVIVVIAITVQPNLVNIRKAIVNSSIGKISALTKYIHTLMILVSYDIFYFYGYQVVATCVKEF